MSESNEAKPSIELKHLASIGDQQYPSVELRYLLDYLRKHGKGEWCDALVEEFDLDDPLVVRHARWVLDAVQGDLGRSTRGGTPVVEYVSHRLTISLELALAAMALAVIVGVPLGLLAASLDGSFFGRMLTSFLSVFQAVPVFITATAFIWLFAVKLQWAPATGWTRISESVDGNLRTLMLPASAIAFAEAGVIARVVRAGVVDVLGEDFIAGAVGKGLSRRYILVRHALRPDTERRRAAGDRDYKTPGRTRADPEQRHKVC